MNQHQTAMTKGDAAPMNSPPIRMSRELSCPLPQAIAFGSVEMGEHMAVDAPRATETTVSDSDPTLSNYVLK